MILFIKITIMDIQAQKALIIEQFKQVNDINLINAIKSILDYAIKKEKDVYDIPEAQKQMVMERYKKVRNKPERLLDWDEAQKTLKSE